MEPKTLTVLLAPSGAAVAAESPGWGGAGGESASLRELPPFSGQVRGEGHRALPPGAGP